MKPYKQIFRTVLFRNPYWKYCVDRIELPSGKPGEYHLVITGGSAMTVPVDEDGKIILVRQYRYTGRRDSIEFPCGGMKEGSSYEETAISELAEEAGFVAGEMEHVGSFNPCNGLLDEICRVYIARNLKYVGARPDETESFELIRVSPDELDAFVCDGTIWDGMTLAAWAIARTRIAPTDAEER
jgi:ADP-ribose pyrophosphatase